MDNEREYLAIDRTALSNERTFLAVIRTSLALLAVGISLIKFLTHHLFDFLGSSFIGLSILVFIFGIIRYVRYKKYLNQLSNYHIHLKVKKTDNT